MTRTPLNVTELSDEYSVNIIEIRPEDIEISETCFQEPLFIFGEKSLHFKFKNEESSYFSFYKDLMATITESGDVKVFNYLKKELLHKLVPPPKPDTNEFGDFI